MPRVEDSRLGRGGTRADRQERARRLLVVLVAAVGLLIPVTVSRYPPLTDLPQLLSQVPLFFEALAGPELEIQWWAPNQLFQAIAGMLWGAVGPAYAGPAGVAMVIAVWLVALLVVAERRDRSLELALLASLMVFNHGFYYGFLNFTLGFSVFLLWMIPRMRRLGSSDEGLLRFVLLAALTYKSHLLWFLVGCGVWAFGVGRKWWIERRIDRASAFEGAVLLPLVVLSLRFSQKLSEQEFTSRLKWGGSPLAKISSLEWWRSSTLGGLAGHSDTLLLLLLTLVAVLALVRAREDLRAKLDVTLLALGGLLVIASIFLPAIVGKTMHFGSRWLAPAIALVLLGLPDLGIRKSVARALVLVVVWSYGSATALAWWRADRREIAGLEEVLEKIPPRTRLMGLMRREHSDYVNGYPYFHLYAWAEVRRGARTHFSFADHPTSPVVFRQLPRQLPYHPMFLQPRDLVHFDQLLVFGSSETFEQLPGLRTVIATGEWRLFEIDAETVTRALER